jgi:hypothetical protein
VTGSLSEARTAVSSAKVAVVVVGEIGRSAVYMRYKNGREHCLGEHRHELGIGDVGQRQL